MMPLYVPPIGSLSRASAQTLVQISERANEIQVNLAGFDQVVPLIYGEPRVTGLWLVRPVLFAGDLVFAIAWGLGEIEGVQTVYINSAAVPGGVTMAHYRGTQDQGIDGTLSGAIAGFADRYPGVAYTVFQVPTGAITGFPQQAQIEAVVRGRKVLDPRTNVHTWSENPALCMADWISAGGQISPGLPVYGVEDAADRCDETIGGSIRCELALVSPVGLSLTEMLDLFATYAECLWSFEDDGVLLVPDAPVTAPDAVLTESDAMNFRMIGADGLRSPTQINISYRAPSGTASPWLSETATQSLAGVDTGDTEIIPSNISLPGVKRFSEASRKALMRLRRLSFPGTYAWQAFDEGVRFQRGDVVQLPNFRGLHNTLCRVLSIEMVSPGRYQITAEHYDPDMYPDDFLPDSTTTIPVGGIVPFVGSMAPAGWSFFDAANNRYLVGASSTHAPGETYGSASWSVSGLTAADGAHSGTESQWIYGAFSGVGNGAFLVQNVPDPGHQHGVTGSGTHNPAARNERLIIKTGAAGNLPTNAMVWADGQLISAALAEVTNHLGRLARASGTAGNTGTASPFSISLSLAPAGAHWHVDEDTQGQIDFAPTFGPVAYDNVSVPDHSHGSLAFLTATASIRRRRLVHYLATVGTEVIPGAIIGFDPSESIPAGWYECDGTEGTVDLRDYYIERSSSANAGTAAGDNTISYSGLTAPDGLHNHKGTNRGTRTATIGLHENDTGEHQHLVSGSFAFEPPAYAMKFIQYTGVTP
jgi:hypothetical protein